MSRSKKRRGREALLGEEEGESDIDIGGVDEFSARACGVCGDGGCGGSCGVCGDGCGDGCGSSLLLLGM